MFGRAALVSGFTYMDLGPPFLLGRLRDDFSETLGRDSIEKTGFLKPLRSPTTTVPDYPLT